MPYFSPGYAMTPDWQQADPFPAALVLSFQDPREIRELAHFCGLFIRFCTFMEQDPSFAPPPIIRDADGNEVSRDNLRIFVAFGKDVRLTFYFFGEYYRELLDMYCRSIRQRFPEDTIIQNAINRVARDHRLDLCSHHALH